MGSRSSTRQVQGLTRPSVELAHSAAPGIKDYSYSIEYSKLLLAQFLVSLLSEESSKEMEVFNAPTFCSRHRKSYWCTTKCTRHLSCLKEFTQVENRLCQPDGTVVEFRSAAGIYCTLWLCHWSYRPLLILLDMR